MSDWLNHQHHGHASDYHLHGNKADITGDGLPDWTGVIERQGEARIAVLAGERHRRLRVEAVSKPFSLRTGQVEIVEVTGRDKFSVQLNRKAGCGVAADDFGFQKLKGQWRLVREDYLAPDCGKKHAQDFSVDFAQGAITVTPHAGVASTRRVHFPVYLLKNFSGQPVMNPVT